MASLNAEHKLVEQRHLCILIFTNSMTFSDLVKEPSTPWHPTFFMDRSSCSSGQYFIPTASFHASMVMLQDCTQHARQHMQGWHWCKHSHRTYLGLLYVQSSCIKGKEDVWNKDRVVWDVRAPQIQQPGNFIQGCDKQSSSFCICCIMKWKSRHWTSSACIWSLEIACKNGLQKAELGCLPNSSFLESMLSCYFNIVIFRSY